MITVALSLVGLSLLGSVGFIAANLSKAPQGYQDEYGFHEVRTTPRDTSRQFDFPAEAIIHNN